MWCGGPGGAPVRPLLRGNMSAEAIAIVGVGVALLAVLTPLLLALGRRMDRIETRINALTADMAEVRRDLHALAERVARIEGALTGPWRPPANGNPVPAATPPPEAAA